jgi:hypothetical protein
MNKRTQREDNIVIDKVEKYPVYLRSNVQSSIKILGL